MDRDFQDLNAQCSSDSEQATEQATEQTANVQCIDSYSPKEAASAVGISDRTVFKYAEILIRLWGESEIREDGLYTQLAIDEMKRMKEMKPVRYEKAVRRELGLPEAAPTAPISQPGLVHVESPFGFTIETKASQRVETLRGELVALEEEADSDLQNFLAIAAEIESEDEAFNEQDELEWQRLRSSNARKWLKRRAILDRDKQQILQGDVLSELKKRTAHGEVSSPCGRSKKPS
ncbi:MAG: hypothetical protein SVX43_03700 [Cyanobacteriota bacterium]|nr:hypothetical protein [Cyanobacteriota bacterium]